jgi:ribose transport system permease protein
VNAQTTLLTSERIKDRILGLLQKYVVVLVLLICLAIFQVISPVFLSWDNILNILWQNSYLVIATLGMAILLIGGCVDLALGYELSFGGVIPAACIMWWGLPVWFAVLAGILTCVILSMINGILTIKLKINSMMVTLATMTIYSGIGFIITDSKAIFDLPDSLKIIGQGSILGVIPISALIMVAMIAIASFILNLTYLGRYIYAVGGNMEAARLAGVNVQKIRFIFFLLAGLFFGISAVLLLSRTGSASANMAAGNEFTCITAALLGGVSLAGGEGKLWSTIVGVFILGVLANGMQIIGLGTYPQYIAKGIILLAALGFDMYQKSKTTKTQIFKVA